MTSIPELLNRHVTSAMERLDRTPGGLVNFMRDQLGKPFYAFDHKERKTM